MSRKKTIKRNAPEDSPPCPAKAELTEQEKARVNRYRERCKIAPSKFKKLDGYDRLVVGKSSGDPELQKVQLSEAFGTVDHHLQGLLTSQIAEAFEGVLSSDQCDLNKAAGAANQAMAILAGIQPRDELEALLLIQMIAVHNMSMACARRAMLSDQVPVSRQSNINMATKLTRTYMAQMHALKSYRKEEQNKTSIGTVNVNDNAQAVVGDVSTSGGNNEKNSG